ncbi:emopamil-binding family protein [Humibacter sp. RRB41]|uniref:EXPERA domain-containing protein n=1 Tax=Humibacter sp. RRB41 TaxID=2919946 RepID=UPI001FAA24C1|nr:emopamil-binding family protein [Humibacter sp. RRB41]
MSEAPASTAEPSSSAEQPRASVAAPAAKPANLPLSKRPIDILFLVIFSAFIITCIISDSVEGLGLDQVKDSPNLLVQWNYWYASNFDPLYQSHPVWLRFISGTSAFVYVAFYVLLIISIVRKWNWIQLPSVIYATMIIALTGIPIFGVEFFGSAAERTPNPGMFLAFNLPYIVFPLLLLIRMRKPLPFTRAF